MQKRILCYFTISVVKERAKSALFDCYYAILPLSANRWTSTHGIEKLFNPSSADYLLRTKQWFFRAQLIMIGSSIFSLKLCAHRKILEIAIKYTSQKPSVKLKYDGKLSVIFPARIYGYYGRNFIFYFHILAILLSEGTGSFCSDSQKNVNFSFSESKFPKLPLYYFSKSAPNRLLFRYFTPICNSLNICTSSPVHAISMVIYTSGRKVTLIAQVIQKLLSGMEFQMSIQKNKISSIAVMWTVDNIGFITVA